MKLQHAAVIGHPIGHTMSPFIHKRLFALEGFSVSYQVLDVPDLSASLPALRSLDCFNVTIPHKGAIIPFLDELEENARRFGSVNTVKVEAGRMKGYTTDGAGCYKALENHGVDCSGRVLLLGNGGAARAMAFEAAVRQRDLDLTVACRESSQPKAVALAQEVAAFLRERGDRAFRLSIKTYEELEEESLPGHSALGFDLLLNATSVGMYPNTGESPVSGAVLSRCAAVFDAVYNPAQTELLRLAGGGRPRDLVWLPLPPGGHCPPLPRCPRGTLPDFPGKRNGEGEGCAMSEPDKKRARRRRRRPPIKKGAPAAQKEGQAPLSGNIVLCGFMGCGKTSVGKRAAKLLGRQFCDLDSYIERKAGMTVSEIFAQEGEAGFRARETQAAEEVASMQGMVIASGGGTVLSPQNVEAFHRHGAKILFLDVPVAALQERLKNDKRRPLLQVPDRRRVIAELHEKRAPLYRAAADIVVDGGAPAIVVAKRVAQLFQ